MAHFSDINFHGKITKTAIILLLFIDNIIVTDTRVATYSTFPAAHPSP